MSNIGQRLKASKMIVPEHLIPFLKEMIREMNTQKLHVSLVPCSSYRRDNGCGVRSVDSQNVEWYQIFCKLNPRKTGNKPDNSRSFINRNCVILVLQWMVKNKKSRSRYAEYLLEVAQMKYNAHNLPIDEVDLTKEMYD